MRIDTERVPIIPEARTFAAMGLVPGGSQANRGFCAKDLEIDPSVDPVLLDILTDPQTSGGLLIAVPAKNAPALVQKLIEKNTCAASIIGEITAGPPGKMQCR